MTLGNILRERDEQYISNRDASGTWRILDTWHEELKTIGPEDIIADQKEQLSDTRTVYSEHSHIKEKAMDTVLKLAGMDTLVSQRFNDLGKD